LAQYMDDAWLVVIADGGESGRASMVSEGTNTMSPANSCDIRLVARWSLPHTLALRNKAANSSSPRGD
jgi:hypothetical protein